MSWKKPVRFLCAGAVLLAALGAATWALFFGAELRRDHMEAGIDARVAGCQTKVETDGPGAYGFERDQRLEPIDVGAGTHEPAWTTVGGTPLLWKAKEGKGYAVDAEVFPEGLTVVDATHLGPDDPVRRVGKVSAKLPAAELVVALLEAGIIKIGIHVEAVAGRVAEAHGSGEVNVYTSRWVGKALYYTNERNVAFLDFVVRISGDEITLAPPPSEG